MKLDYTSVDDAGLASLQPLTQLRELSLDTVNITDKSVPLLKSFAKLQNLNLYHTYVTDKAELEIQTALPSCKIVYDRDSSLANRRPK